MMNRQTPTTIAALIAVALCGTASAQTLKIGLAAEPTAVDPHYHQTTPNEALLTHIFEPLVAMSPDMELRPALATGWRTVDDTTWEFKLDPAAKFSNGERRRRYQRSAPHCRDRSAGCAYRSPENRRALSRAAQ